jgi:hypothetical protein
VEVVEEEPVVEPATIPTPVTAEPSMISGATSQVIGVPRKRHWHRYIPDQRPSGVRNGMDEYILRCECGETREELRPRRIHPD